MLLWDALLNTGMPTLKCWRNNVLRFNGYLAPFSEEAEETSLLNAVFRSPFAWILGDGSGRGYANEFQFTGNDAGQIARSWVHSAFDFSLASSPAPRLGYAGVIEPTKIRDRKYPWPTNGGEAIINLTNVLDGFDFEEVFVDGAALKGDGAPTVVPGATLAELYVYAKQGADRPTARFEYGPTTLANVRALRRSVEPPINYVIVTGATALKGFAQDIPSRTKYGNWYYTETASDVVEQATLNDKAYALLRPNPIRVIDFTPEFGLENCPKPWDDFWLGDTVGFFARRGALNEDAPVRVNAVTVTIDDNGIETAEVPDPTMPDGEATIRANLSVEVATTTASNYQESPDIRAVVGNISSRIGGLERTQNPPQYTTTTLPDPTTVPGLVIYVSNAAAGSKLQGSNGSAWVSLG